MASKIGAGIAALAGLGLMLVALGSPALAIPGPSRPGVAWLADLQGGAPEKARPPAQAQPQEGSTRPAAGAAPRAPNPPAPLPAEASQTPATAAASAKPAPAAAPAPTAPKPEATPAVSRPVEAAAKPAAPPPHQAPAAPQAGLAARREPPKPEPVVARADSPGAPASAPAQLVPSKPEPAKPPEPGPARPEVARPEAKPADPRPAPKAAEVKPAPKAPEPAPPEEEEGMGVLSIASEPPGAEVFLDGASVGQTPIEIDVPTGLHKVRLAPPGGGAEKRHNVHVKTGRTAELRVSF